MSKKRNKKQDYQDAINEAELFKAADRKEMGNLSFPIKVKFKNKKQKELSEMIKKNKITFIVGSPGSGKTFITLKTAVELLKDDDSGIEDIILSTPIVEVDSVSLGFLPGSEKDKTSPYFEKFYDNLNKIVGKDVTTFLRTSKLITEKIINFIRGTTFGSYNENGEPMGTLCFLDEAQNTTIHQLRTYISRLGENSKMVISGDLDQTDLKLRRGEKTGLEDAILRFKDFTNVGVFTFTEDDIVRDPFLIKIMKRYKDILD